MIAARTYCVKTLSGFACGEVKGLWFGVLESYCVGWLVHRILKGLSVSEVGPLVMLTFSRAPDDVR